MSGDLNYLSAARHGLVGGAPNPLETPAPDTNGPGHVRTRSIGNSLRERFASLHGPEWELRSIAPRAGGVSPLGTPAEGRAWITESLHSGDVVEMQDGVRQARLDAGVLHPASEAGTVPGITTGGKPPGPADGAMESPAMIPPTSCPGTSGGRESGSVPLDGACLPALARLREKLDGDERPDGTMFKECILDIITEVARLHGRRADDILPTIEIEHNLPSARTAFLCGIMIAELVSGCLIRSYAGTPGLRINVTFRHTGAGKILLSVGARCCATQARADPVCIGPADLETVIPIVSRLQDGPERDERGGRVFRIIFCEGGPNAP
jgi:hypothetical protein